VTVVQVRVIDSGQAMDLKPEVFGLTPRVPLLHQALTRELAARRAGTHASRGRSEVSGGGKKPWRQKGTGRARQGSIRATQWKGGGKPFGPRPRSYEQDMPREARRTALRSALSAKLASDALSVIERLELSEPKTKALVERLRILGAAGEPTLLVLAELSDGLRRAARNVPWLQVETPAHTSVYQVLRHARILVDRPAMLAFQEALAR
jgi:large subunit ribosomal protein L4